MTDDGFKTRQALEAAEEPAVSGVRRFGKHRGQVADSSKKKQRKKEEKLEPIQDEPKAEAPEPLTGRPIVRVHSVEIPLEEISPMLPQEEERAFRPALPPAPTETDEEPITIRGSKVLEPPAKKKRTGVGRVLAGIAVALAASALLAVAIRLFVFCVAPVRDYAMEGALRPGEQVAVLQCAYWFADPGRGDIVLLGEAGGERILRVVALPGEMVLIRDGIVYVNGRPLAEPYATGQGENFGPIVVSPDSFFLLGDNRPEAADSRLAAVGPVPRDRIRGRAAAVLYPLENIRPVD